MKPDSRQHLTPRCAAGRETHKVVRKTGERVLKGAHDLVSALGRLGAVRAVEGKGLAQDEQGATETVVQVQVEPLLQLGAEVVLANADRADTAGLARGLQLGRAQSVESLRVDNLYRACVSAGTRERMGMVAPHLVILLELGETVADRETEENVGTKGVDVHVAVSQERQRTCRAVSCHPSGNLERYVPAHGDELGTGQVLESQVVLKETRDADNLFGRGRLSRAPDLRG